MRSAVLYSSAFIGLLKAMYISPEDKSKMVADGIGVAHFIVANFVVLLGQFTSIFDALIRVQADNKGIYFLYYYLDRPVYFLFRGFVESAREDWVLSLLCAQLIIVVSTVLYGFLAYFAIKIYLSLND